ncbi:hypothetical protein [Streptomyces sp. NPDC059788]|uniref:hypothetical protein n=1 Tax=Streptomyces sp. NPDC059788 TaxID=3346948 RepID=UPI003666119A
MRTLDDTSDDVTDDRTDGSPEALTDPGWEVPPVPQEVPEGGMAWLRARVARFSSGEAHARRRALAAGALGGPEAAGVLRGAARVRAEALLRGPGPVEVMARVARVVPAEVLAASLGAVATTETAGLVGDVARAYHAHGEAVPAADRALARLVADFGGTWDEAAAARIGLLVQAYDATAGLIGSAAYALLAGDGAAEPRSGAGADLVAGLLDRVLCADPPVRGTFRAPVGGGDPVRVGLVAADGSLAFGAGAHACPGRAHARALAAGVLDAVRVRGCRLAGAGAGAGADTGRGHAGVADRAGQGGDHGGLAYLPSVNLRVPVALEVVCA